MMTTLILVTADTSDRWRVDTHHRAAPGVGWVVTPNGSDLDFDAAHTVAQTAKRAHPNPHTIIRTVGGPQ